MKYTWEIKLVYLSVMLVWFYLFLTTQAILVFDGIGYEEAGRLINQQGFGVYLQQGPSREPLFPLMVALSLRLGEWIALPYQYVLKIFGGMCLIVTMMVAHRLMVLLKANRVMIVFGLAWIGLSPTLLNTTFWLWSEIAAFPFVLLAVWWTIKSWSFLNEEGNGDQRRPWISVLHGAMVGLMFIGIICVKAIAEPLLWLYLIPFIWQALVVFVKEGDWTKVRPWLIFVISALFIFEGFVQGYKFVNLRINGHYQFTDRGDWALYGNTARRMAPMTLKRMGAAVLLIVDDELCVKSFGFADCQYWTARTSDDIITDKQEQLQELHFSEGQRTHYFIGESLRLIISNPFQALLTMTIEAHKIFFWATPPAFVAYPDSFDAFLFSSFFRRWLCLLTAALCWAGFIGTCILLVKGWLRNGWWRNKEPALWFVFSFVFWYAGVYSFFFILDRYAFPIAPLLVVMVVVVASRLLVKGRS